MSKPKSEYAIQTVGNALRLLEIFHGEAELGVSDLARRLGLHKNNVFRLLATLELDGYVEQSSETDCYRLGVRCLELGNAYARSCTLSERARPVLEELVERLGETAHLGVLRNFEVVHLNGVEPRTLLFSVSRVGKRLPVHCSALGKALLGCSPAATRERFDQTVLAERGLEARTALTLVDGHKLFEQLRVVAGQGFALDLGECEDGLHCAAAPVRGDDERLVAALSISGPASRLGEDVLHREVVPVLNAAAATLSTALGYPG
jgi:DNA-binding IclR family transcriptional regulator